VRSLRGIITRERLYLTLTALTALFGQEAQVTVAGSLELQRENTKICKLDDESKSSISNAQIKPAGK
jgi:hypothetical protein